MQFRMKTFKMSLLAYIAFCAFCTAGLPLYAEGHYFMKQIPLTGPLGQGKFVLVDDEDYDLLIKYKWHLQKGVYAIGAIPCREGNRWQKMVRMHRMIMNAPAEMVVDHIDHNGLNNQKSNLRICTIAQNSQNKRCKGASKFHGVSWSSQLKKWKVTIRGAGVNVYIGYFSNEVEAALKYNEAALKYYGEFANLNIIPTSE